MDLALRNSLISGLGIDKDQYKLLRDNLKLDDSGLGTSGFIQDCRQDLGYSAKKPDKVVL